MRYAPVFFAASLALLLTGGGVVLAQPGASTLNLSAASAKAQLRKGDKAACKQLAADKNIPRRDSAGYVAVCMADRQAVRKAASKK